MKESNLIAKQQLEIESLKEDVNAMQEGFQSIYNHLYSIGAPLNDNVLNFSKEQLTPFFRIGDIVSDFLPNE